MSKKYGNFYEEDLDYWQQLPLVSSVLTSPHMGAWLLRRQENIKKQIGERLCEIIARRVITNESLGEDEDAKTYNQGLEVAMEIIKDYCEVGKDGINN
jgi:hypothetical protein